MHQLVRAPCVEDHPTPKRCSGDLFQPCCKLVASCSMHAAIQSHATVNVHMIAAKKSSANVSASCSNQCLIGNSCAHVQRQNYRRHQPLLTTKILAGQQKLHGNRSLPLVALMCRCCVKLSHSGAQTYMAHTCTHPHSKRRAHTHTFAQNGV